MLAVLLSACALRLFAVDKNSKIAYFDSAFLFSFSLRIAHHPRPELVSQIK